MTRAIIDAMEQLHHEHLGRRRDLRAEQYVYEIGSYHYNWHRDFELLLVLTGTVEVCSGGRFSVLTPSDLALINSNEGHATLAQAPHSTVLLLHIDPDYISAFDPREVVPRFECKSTAVTRQTEPFAHLRRVLASMMLTSLDTTPAGLAAWERDLADVVSTLYRTFRSSDTTLTTGEVGARDAAIGRATTFIDRHYTERISLHKLAATTGYSSARLSEVFSQQVGMTPSEYITRVRLAHAVRDLADEDLRISDVAFANGFPDLKALGVAFRRAFGKTPSQYRILLKEMGGQLADVDISFHKQFVPRNDPVIAPVLQTLAGRDDSDCASGDAPILDTTVTAELEELAEAARTISDELTRLTGRGQALGAPLIKD